MMNYKTFDKMRKIMDIQLKEKQSNEMIINKYLVSVKNKVISLLLENWDIMKKFEKEYKMIDDKMILDDTKMILKIIKNDYKNTRIELQKQSKYFEETKRLYNYILIKKQIQKSIRKGKNYEM